MDYMDIDEDPIISAKDSVDDKVVDKMSNDERTNSFHSREEDKDIVDLVKQNGTTQAFEKTNCSVSSNADRGKGIDLTNSPKRFKGQRRLVRNGCISPRNIAKANELAKNSNLNSSEFGHRDLISEANDCYKIRGKGAISHSFSRKVPNAKTMHFSGRNSSLGGQPGDWSDDHHHAETMLAKRQKAVSNSTNHGLRILDPVMEELPTTEIERNKGSRTFGGGSYSDDDENESDLRGLQVEADEIFARKLQEELYNETPVFGVDERGSSGTNSYRQIESSSTSQNSSVVRRQSSEARVSTLSMIARLRARFLGEQPSTTSSSSSSRRNSLFPPDVDVDMRIHILEALEELSDMGMYGDLQVDRDFNENDYEMLLALDENNCHFGATPAQIDGLPQSTVLTDNVEETCAICLDTPSTGETMSRLPCLHIFHKDCIDPWLRQKTLCPVCKSSIIST